MRVRCVTGCLIALLSAVCPAPGQAATPLGISLVEAVRSGDKERLRALLKEPDAVNAPVPDGTTALHWATDLDDSEAIELLIRAGADVKAVNRYGVTPLYSAALNGNAGVIELLLEAGADVNAALPEGETALMTAARTGKPEAVKVLLAHGAHVALREGWKQQTALMWAVHEGNNEAAKLLLDAGADLQVRSRFGFTPMLFAARQGQLATIDLLVGYGADVNDTLPDGTSALVVAIQGVSYEAAARLLHHGANPNASAQGWSALHQVVWSRRPQRGQNNPGQLPQGDMSSLELAKLLVKKGADVNLRQSKEPHTDQEGRNSLNRIGSTPFLLAAKACDLPMMEVLVNLGADPHLANEDGTTPLMVAAGVGIFSQGENPGTTEEAADAVKFLLDLGADPNVVDKNNDTALHGPAWRGSNGAVEHLVAAGANTFQVRNTRGWRPLTIAEGVFANARVQMNFHTAKLLRQLMIERGLDPDEGDTVNAGGALRLHAREVVDDTLLEATTPEEIQRALRERRAREAAEAGAEAAKKKPQSGSKKPPSPQ